MYVFVPMTKRLLSQQVMAVHVRENQQLGVNAFPLPQLPRSFLDTRKFGHTVTKFTKVLPPCSPFEAEALPGQVVYGFCKVKFELNQSIFIEALNNQVNLIPFDMTSRLGVTTKKGTNKEEAENAFVPMGQWRVTQFFGYVVPSRVKCINNRLLQKRFHQAILILGRREGYLTPRHAAKQVWSNLPQTYTPLRLTSRTISTTGRLLTPTRKSGATGPLSRASRLLPYCSRTSRCP